MGCDLSISNLRLAEKLKVKLDGIIKLRLNYFERNFYVFLLNNFRETILK